jgi:signal transduction histidine kinase
LHDVPNQGFADDVAYETHDLGCYLGTPITVDGTLYGTVCFVDENPRSDPFRGEELPFVEILARMLGYELEYRQHEVELDRGSRLVDVFSRILRHNLRNDMTVVRGHVSRLLGRMDQQPATEEAITATIDEMISLAEKARELEAIVRTEFEMQELSIPSVLEDSIADLESTYPDATVALEGPEEATLFAMPTLETALHELLENAVKHAGDEPTCEVTVEAAPGRMTITVADDGPGLTDQEQRVLEDEAETPLVHGSGLGLWMVDWIVGGHDGTIEASVTEAGTTITVSIPRPLLDDGSSDGWSA